MVMDGGLRVVLVKRGDTVGDKAVTVEGHGVDLRQRGGLGKRRSSVALSVARGR
jgi:hypothetical protein